MFFPHSSSSPADLTVTAISSSLLTFDAAATALTFPKPQPSPAVEGAAGYSQSPPPFPLSRALVSYCSRTAAIADHAGTTRLLLPPHARASPSIHDAASSHRLRQRDQAAIRKRLTLRLGSARCISVPAETLKEKRQVHSAYMGVNAHWGSLGWFFVPVCVCGLQSSGMKIGGLLDAPAVLGFLSYQSIGSAGRLFGIGDGVYSATRDMVNGLILFFIDGIMKSASPSTSCIRSARYELQAKSSEKFTDLNEISDMPNALDSLAETTPDRETIFINNATAKQFPDDFSSNFGQDIEMYYEQVLGHHPYCGSGNLTEIDNFSSPFKFFSTLNDYIDEMVWIPENHFGVSSQCRSMSNGILVAKQIEHSLGNGMERLSEAQNRDVELLIWENKENAGISNKKLCKTRRCTEQASNFKSRCYGETRGAIPKKPRSLRTSRIRPKLDDVKETMINEGKFSTSAAESKPTFESELKKHNKIWTLTEVIKLIEGVSHCGVGRWIEIKKYSFPAFAFRNSIDLKVLDASHLSMLSQI
ncbi:hypothetical protein ZIOFF_065400 [Zingiber officinale]|uniref:Uncharacterized protein n=1 Tax=Zingiber officinale TaxID=94328 RepID=A0A8J5EXA4_ZINOF|nr:hypothetical protein ZIOFF_065400 [Zingiber officinale]